MWTEERVAALKKLWASGLSASRIAEQFGTTRNAVLGKAFRLNLAPHRDCRTIDRNKRTAMKLRKAASKRTAEKVRAVVAKVAFPVEPLPSPDAADIARASFAELQPGMCKFIPGDSRGDKIFCGDDAVPGLPYCPCHAKRCYQPANVRSRDHAFVPPSPEMRRHRKLVDA